jgi:hypothetical protein
MPNVTPRATASPCGSHDAPAPTAAAGDGSGHVLVAAAARAQHGGRETIAPFSHPFRTFIRPVPLPPPSLPYSSPLFIYGFTLFFVSLLFPPSTARAPLYWLFFYRFILYKYARSNSYTSYTKTEYTLRQGHRALLFAQSGEAGPHCWCCSLSVTRYSRSLERVRTREPPAILTTSSSTPR